jgi:hypothetical protein
LETVVKRLGPFGLVIVEIDKVAGLLPILLPSNGIILEFAASIADGSWS